MDMLRAEWKKWITFREIYVALGLAAVLTLWWGLPTASPPEDVWRNLYNFNFNVAPILILFLQTAGLSRLFCGENAGRTAPLLRASRFGPRRTFGGKVALGLCYAAVTSLLPGVAVLCLNVLGCGGVPVLLDGSGTISRIPAWERMGALTLWGWEMFFSLLGGLCAAGQVLLASALARRPVAAMTGAALCLALPAALRVGTVLFLSQFPVSNGLVVLLDGVYRLCGWSWTGILTYELLETSGGALWKAVLYCLCLLAAELILTWLAWKRRDGR